MPHSKPKSHGLHMALLGLMVLLCGFLLRSNEPIAQAPATQASASPAPTQMEAVALPAETPTAVPTQIQVPIHTATARPTFTPSPMPAPTATPTLTPTETPATLAERHVPASIRLGLTDEEEPTASPTVAAAVTQAALPTAEQAFIVMEQGTPEPTIQPTATPRPGPTPTYEYANDDVRIEIMRHDTNGVVYFAAEIWLTDIKQLESAFSSDKFDSATEPVSDIAVRHDAVLAINGDFATFNNGGIIIRNGEAYRTNRSTRQLLVIDANGDFIPYVEPPEKAEEAAEQFLAEGVWQTLVFGPVLVADGEAVPLPTKFFINTKGALEPRTAVAQLGPLHYLFLVVDGRQDGYSKGVSLPRLQEIFLEYGAQVAFNLDGGGSATLCYMGNVLNRPANGGQRHVPDILYIGK